MSLNDKPKSTNLYAFYPRVGGPENHANDRPFINGLGDVLVNNSGYLDGMLFINHRSRTLSIDSLSAYKAVVRLVRSDIVSRLMGRIALVVMAALLAFPAPSASAMPMSQMDDERHSGEAVFMIADAMSQMCAANDADHMKHCDSDDKIAYDDECCGDNCDGCICTSCLSQVSGIMFASISGLNNNDGLKQAIQNCVVEACTPQVPKSPPK